MTSKSSRSTKNRAVENEGVRLLLSLDKRFQLPSTATKKALLGALAPEGSWGPRSFDLILTAKPMPLIEAHEVPAAPLSDVTLIEMKSTREAILDHHLGNFFFGATEREYELAARLGDQYKFAFVVLSSDNSYGRPFAVLLTLAELESKTKTQRVQFQVNLRSQAAIDDGPASQPLGILLH